MRALVTGAFGFAGKFLVEHLLSKGDDVLGTYVEDKPPNTNCSSVRLDIADEGACNQVVCEYRPDVIYHLAAISFVPEAEQSFDRTLRINVNGPNNIFLACEDLKQRSKVVLVGSAQVYGNIETHGEGLDENTPLDPKDNYSLSKAMCELVAARYSKSKYTSSVILRPFNHIGPTQRSDFVVSSFALQLAQIKMGLREPVMKVGNLKTKRDFTDVRDIVRAYRLSATTSGASGAFNLCSGRAVSIEEILNSLIDISGVNVTIETDPARVRNSDIQELFGSYKRAKNILGWEPEIPLRDSLKDTFEYWLSQLKSEN